jgi:hypothetical protein
LLAEKVNSRSHSRPCRSSTSNDVSDSVIVDVIELERLRVIPMSRKQGADKVGVEILGLFHGAFIPAALSCSLGEGLDSIRGELLNVGDADLALGRNFLQEAEYGGMPFTDDTDRGAVT